MMFNFIIITSLLSVITINAEHICAPSMECNVDCSIDDCNTTIDGTRATSLHVLCNSTNACSFTNILLPNATSQTSTITCSKTLACFDSLIYYFGDATSSPSNNNIELICTMDDACYNTSVIADKAGNFKLNCDEAKCRNLYISVVNVNHISLRCKAGFESNSTDYGGCYGSADDSFFINATNATNISLTCVGYRGCNNILVNAERAGTFSIFATPLGLYDGEYIVKNVLKSLEITCIGDGLNVGCSNSPEFHIPNDLSKLTINCYGTGCSDIKLTKDDSFTEIADANINFNGCHQCGGLPTSYRNKLCLGIQIKCENKGVLIFPPKYLLHGGWNCDSDHYHGGVCNCYNIAQAFKNAYIEDLSDKHCINNININRTIECPADSECEIDCDIYNCVDNIIEATQSNSLTVICNIENSCQDTIIYAPIKILSTMIIMCNGIKSCSGVTLFAKNSYSVTMIVSPQGMKYYGKKTTIIADNIQNSFILTCIGNGSIGHGCDGLYVYVPIDVSKFRLNCYGTGCGEFAGLRLNTDLDKGLQQITAENIYWNGCTQCYEADDCLYGIYLYCYSNYYGEEKESHLYSGSGMDLYCDEHSGSVCGCNELLTAFTHSYMDNSSDSNCISLPENRRILCARKDNCSIDCSIQNCVNKIIDGLDASSLTVNCKTINSCKNTLIYATIGKLTSTTIVCGAEISNSNSRYPFFDKSGCNGNFQIFAHHAYDLTVIGMPHGIVKNSIVGFPIIYAQNIQNSFTLNCIGNGTNDNFNNNSEYTKTYSTYTNKHYGCNGLRVYLPILDDDLHKFTMNCYGTGCGDIYFQKHDGLANITNANINFNGCLQCKNGNHEKDDVASNCLGNIRIYCDYLSRYISFGKTDGFNCGSNDCGCNALSAAFQSGYNDDTSDEYCILGDTVNEDNIPLVIILSITISVLVCFVIILICIYAKKKRKNNVAEVVSGDTDNEGTYTEQNPLNR